MDLEKEVDAFDTDEIGGEYLADSTNHGWGFELGAMRRDGELEKMDSNIEIKILSQLIPWLEDENHSIRTRILVTKSHGKSDIDRIA